MKYYELVFQTNPCSETINDVLSALLAEVGFETFIPNEDGCLQAYIQQSFYDQEAVYNVLADFPLPDVSISYEMNEPADENWNETWENEGFQPICVEGKLVICDTRHDVDEELDKILIHPRQAFGTGSHQTTRMILSTLLDMDLTGKTVIDAGCGTGILGFMCLKKGADRILSYDIDEWSVSNTLDNARLNNLDLEKIDVRLGDSSVLEDVISAQNEDKCDLLIANINRNILLGDIPRFVKSLKSTSNILFSGFYEEDVDYLLEATKEYGFQLKEKKNDGEWAMLLLSR